MDSWQILLLVTKLWLLFFALSASFGNSKLAAANKAHAERRNLATQNPGFISIDCGVDEDYLDEVTGTFYASDRDFISTGKNQDILPEFTTSNPYYSRQLNSLRIFPEGKKNCYTLQPEQGKNHSYLIRASFQYGNYDAKNQTPKFDLHLGVNYLWTVELKDANAWRIFEIFHFSLSNTIDVCLINTGSGIPFVSVLELRSLHDSTYRIESGSLATVWRYDVGSTTNISIRHKDDAYDRIWWPYSNSDWISISTTLDIDEQHSNDSYELPAEVLRTAAQPRSGISSLSYTYITSCSSCEYYVYFHFAEIVKIAEGQRREFTITLNGVNHGPFILEYLKPLTIRPQKSPIQGNVSFSISSTVKSALPPILNAFEIQGVYLLPLSPTNPADVDAIIAIKQRYKINRIDWQGDPCIPRVTSWTGLSCSNNNNDPRIVSLNLSSSKLTGEIAPSLFNLKVIKSLDLSYNELIGTVPEFLAQLPNLTVLNLTGNKLTGVVPQSLMDKSIGGRLQLSLDGNPNLCLTNSCGKKKRSFLLPVIAATISILVLILLIIIAIFWRMKGQGDAITETRSQSSAKPQNQSFTYYEVVRITNNFGNIIGEGGFGKVYLGKLQDGTHVAVKLSESLKQGRKEFQAEVQLLLIVHHRNLVSLIGYCNEHENMALIYEYMPNGNLQQYLSDGATNVLSWRERLQIAVDTAHGLEYLHNGCKPSIIHRDIKTSNILLNENMQAKIADFGLSRVFATEGGSLVTTHPAGTLGYLDPEFHSSGHLNKKSDVYSFGIVLFELITGQPAIIKGHEYSTHIVQWVNCLIECGDIKAIVDPRLQGEFNTNSTWKLVEIAMSCVPPTAIQRPDMSHVLAELTECLATEMTSLTHSNTTRSSDSLEWSVPSAR